MYIGKIHFYNDSRQTLQIKCHCSKTSFSISQRVLEGSELFLSLIQALLFLEMSLLQYPTLLVTEKKRLAY